VEYIFGAMLTSALVSFFICRYRCHHLKRISWGTLGASVLAGNVITLLSLLFYEEGWDVFTREAWREPKGGWGLVFVFLGFVAASSVIPSLAVSVFYERRAKRNQVAAT